MARIRSKQVSYYGHTFDSQAEGEYYLILRSNPTVEKIELQPQYTLIEAFTVPCYKCKGSGRAKSKKTGNDVQCSSCKSTAVTKRRPWSYKADFKVTYKDGQQEVIDVKGYANERFPLVKKMFEYTTGQELIVVKKKKGEWIRV
ncbi:DUF1064 domain-containing protein [Alkalihalophilus marmarensis]|uniref:DUF1064 domain-containing protein n=1 Tax=Alkalihalophilus marmarensis TaxID=521377 RepID=UPI00203EF74A|nr:DUF1064 domain-containing protein [Alkalihalophilus marmarensis]MCM3488801.1 DUF1064 domain-containing protein [Alkalihalophilus marmarensis]